MVSLHCRLLLMLALGASAGSACRQSRPVPPAAPALAPARIAASSTAASASADKATPVSAASEPAPRPLRRCFEAVPTWIESAVADLLDHAGQYLDRSDFEGALACAEEAARQMPRSIEAHNDRATALGRLGRLDEARDALGLSLAIAPSDPETLELAADLYVNQLAPTAERATIGLEYARRGSRTVARRDRDRAAHLALLEGQALIDLGRSAEALPAIATALKIAPGDAAARYERGVALFELCRFEEAERAFMRVLEVEPGHAHALYHLALVSERAGDQDRAQAQFNAASTRDPKSFPPVPNVSGAEFERRVRAVQASLPHDVQRDLADIQVEAADLPAIEDLTAERPPLSPTILGLFRGLPLGRSEAGETPASSAGRGGRARQGRVAAGPPPSGGPASCAVSERAIVLYRSNLLRSIQTLSELDRAIERTLLHEVGHLRGEDDGSLRDRGLE